MLDKKVLLVHGLANKDLNILKSFNKEYKIITQDMTGTKINDIILEQNLVKSENKIPNEKVVLINGYTDAAINVLIKIIKGAMGKNVIIAVITENSCEWTFDYLLREHLIKERVL